MDQYQVPEKVKQLMEYDLIKLYTELPRFPHLRTKLLYTFCQIVQMCRCLKVNCIPL